MVIIDQYSRRIIGFGIHEGNLNGKAICRMFNKAIAGSSLPRHLSSDNDPLFQYFQWKANLRILEIEELKTVPYVPLSHPFIERLIGTIRREYLDQVFFWNTCDLQSKLETFKKFYNHERTHSGIRGKSPYPHVHKTQNDVISLNNYKWKNLCNGLFQLPIAA